MAKKEKLVYPNPAVWKTKDNMDLKLQGENLKEVGEIAWEMIKDTDWKKFGKERLADLKSDGQRIAEEFKAFTALSGEEKLDRIKNGEKHLGRLYREGAMATTRREWKGVESTIIDFKGWLRMWGMLLGTFSKDLIPALNTTLWYRWMISYVCCVNFLDKNTMGQRGRAWWSRGSRSRRAGRG